MNILLFGAPGAGKGTQSSLLVSEFDFTHISTGDLLRAAVAAKTELGLKAKSFMDSGKLVPDEIVIGLVRERLSEIKGKSFILDGFPRNKEQAVAVDELFNELNISSYKAVFIEVPSNSLIERLEGRRLCGKCGAVFHLKFSPPKIDGLCDKCNSALVHRSDDHRDVIISRLEVYNKNMQPLKDYFSLKSLSNEVSGEGSTQEVFERVKKLLK